MFEELDNELIYFRIFNCNQLTKKISCNKSFSKGQIDWSLNMMKLR